MGDTRPDEGRPRSRSDRLPTTVHLLLLRPYQSHFRCLNFYPEISGENRTNDESFADSPLLWKDLCQSTSLVLREDSTPLVLHFRHLYLHLNSNTHPPEPKFKTREDLCGCVCVGLYFTLVDRPIGNLVVPLCVIRGDVYVFVFATNLTGIFGVIIQYNHRQRVTFASNF